MKNKIKEMLELQYKLNVNTNGEEWKKWVTPNGKIINWKRCIYMETAEAIDSVSWKHWKNIEWGIDADNFRVEIVDIWHFLMAYLLEQMSMDDAIKIVYQNIEWGPFSEKLPSELNSENNLKIDDILLPYEELMAYSLVKTNSQDYIIDFVKSFFTCVKSSAMTFDDLYSLYIWKNVLNKFRQDNGYKQWTYKKIWSNWQEDNVTMQYIIKQNPNLSFEELYAELEKEYKK